MLPSGVLALDVMINVLAIARIELARPSFCIVTADTCFVEEQLVVFEVSTQRYVQRSICTRRILSACVSE